MTRASNFHAFVWNKVIVIRRRKRFDLIPIWSGVPLIATTNPRNEGIRVTIST